MAGVMTELPTFIPDWPNDAKAMIELEIDLRDDGLWPSYSRNLQLMGVTDVASAHPHRRCEAALAAVRATSN